MFYSIHVGYLPQSCMSWIQQPTTNSNSSGCILISIQRVSTWTPETISPLLNTTHLPVRCQPSTALNTTVLHTFMGRCKLSELSVSMTTDEPDTIAISQNYKTTSFTSDTVHTYGKWSEVAAKLPTCTVLLSDSHQDSRHTRSGHGEACS